MDSLAPSVSEEKEVCIRISDTTHIRKPPKYRVITTHPQWKISTTVDLLQQPLVQSQLKQKLSSYFQQDKLKKIADPSAFLTFSDLNALLIKSQMQCYYCHEPVELLYDKVCQSNQWTLDRIRNEEGHNKGNVCIACLKCNLKRRRTPATAFYFTKNVVVERTN